MCTRCASAASYFECFEKDGYCFASLHDYKNPWALHSSSVEWMPLEIHKYFSIVEDNLGEVVLAPLASHYGSTPLATAMETSKQAEVMALTILALTL